MNWIRMKVICTMRALTLSYLVDFEAEILPTTSIVDQIFHAEQRKSLPGRHHPWPHSILRLWIS